MENIIVLEVGTATAWRPILMGARQVEVVVEIVPPRQGHRCWGVGSTRGRATAPPEVRQKGGVRTSGRALTTSIRNVELSA